MDQAGGEPASAGRAPGDIGVVDAYKKGWSTMKAHFAILLGGFLVTLLVNMVPSVLNPGAGPAAPTTPPDPSQLGTYFAVTWGFGLLIAAPLAYGLFYLYLQAVRDQDPSLGDVLEGFRTYLASLASVVLVGLITFVGFLLLIVPGLIAAIRLSFVPFLVTAEDLGAVDAIKESWARTKGHGWSLFGVALLAISVVFVGVLLFLVGVIPAIMLVYAAFAAYFDGVSARPSPAAVDRPAGGTPAASG